MTAREWQPGDVAAGPWPEHAAEGEVTFSERRIVRFDGPSAGWARADDPDDYLLDSHDWSPTNIARPLAVIDPEDREQVARLVTEWQAADRPTRTTLDRWQAALREFANPTPPRPAEPTGLGAVVEDAEGRRWVRWTADPGPAPWRTTEPNTPCWSWSYLPAVRVLSEGVTA